MEEEIFVLLIVATAVIGFPWLIFHYVTKWKQAKTLTVGDEQLLDELHDMARRLDERLCTIERITAAENPHWKQACLPESGPTVDTDFATTRTRIRRGEEG